ncbi:MAG: hypothetical protein LC667_10685 [Thioalkalivibrio sp.]|nr:hypothetical protein [Thioalkalivibrio sp.]
MDTSSTSPGIPKQHPGILQDVRSLARELRGQFRNQVNLAALETRQAGESLIWMVTLGVMVGGLLLARQRSVSAHGTILRHRIHERMASPSLLGSAAGLGFLLGNRTQGPDSGLSWVRMAVSSMPWVNTLFNTLQASAPTQVSRSTEF